MLDSSDWPGAFCFTGGGAGLSNATGTLIVQHLLHLRIKVMF